MKPDRLVHPARGDGFHFAHHIGKTMRGAKSDEQVNMIGDSTNRFWVAAQSPNRAAEICMKVIAPFWINARRMIFGREHDMVMEA